MTKKTMIKKSVIEIFISGSKNARDYPLGTNITTSFLMIKNKITYTSPASTRVIGFRTYPAAYSHHLIDLMRIIECHMKVKLYFIISINEFNQDPDWYITHTAGFNLLLCDDEQFSLLYFFDIVFLQENYLYNTNVLPQNVAKIGLAHGVDVDLSMSLTLFGGAFEYDYLLLSKAPNKHTFGEYLDTFPSQLRDHCSSNITLIPFGSPKLDRMIKAVNLTSQSAIIYHLSHLSMEAEWVLDVIYPTLLLLLKNFPNNQIIFRPFPKYINSDFIRDLELSFSTYPNFFLSKGASYIDDYAKGAVMIAHRKYDEHLFNLATGFKTIIYEPNQSMLTLEPSIKPDYIIYSNTDLVTQVKYCLEFAKTIMPDNRFDIAKQAGIYNVGKSLNALISAIETILRKQDPPDTWPIIALQSDVDIPLNTLLKIYLYSGLPFHSIALIAASKFPKSVIFQLLVSEACSRCFSFEGEYWTIAFDAFYNAINHVNLSPVMKHMLTHWWILNGDKLMQRHQIELQMREAKLRKKEIFIIKQMETITRRLQNIAGSYEYFLENIETSCIYELGSKSETLSLSLIGSEELAVSFIQWNNIHKRHHIVSVHHLDAEKHGSKFYQYTIESLTSLAQKKNPILICYKELYKNVYLYLRRTQHYTQDILFWDNNPCWKALTIPMLAKDTL
ncbi:MAG: hypothetical protein KAH18_05385 [Psychromonas sp.]|nr:hypothetical protein [Psychromonas sp.]